MELASRATYRGQITKLVKSATEYLQSPDARICDEEEKLDCIEEELGVLIDRLKAAHENLKRANDDVRALVKQEDYEREAESIAEYDDRALAAIVRLKQRLAKVQQHQGRLFSTVSPLGNNAINTANTTQAVKLPKLHLKRFSGEFRDWIPFWEQFSSAVHENHSLSAIDKFNYLQSLLFGKAAETISGLTPTQACYESAISLLKEEYGNTDKIVDQTMQRLLSLQPVSSRTDVVGLRRLYNSVTSSTRSLSALGISSAGYYVMLKGVLLRCLPNELRVDFHRHCNNSAVEKTNKVEASINEKKTRTISKALHQQTLFRRQ